MTPTISNSGNGLHFARVSIIVTGLLEWEGVSPLEAITSDGNDIVALDIKIHWCKKEHETHPILSLASNPTAILRLMEDDHLPWPPSLFGGDTWRWVGNFIMNENENDILGIAGTWSLLSRGEDLGEDNDTI